MFDFDFIKHIKVLTCHHLTGLHKNGEIVINLGATWERGFVGYLNLDQKHLREASIMHVFRQNKKYVS